MYTLKYYLTCDFSKDDAIDRVYLNIYDMDDEVAWAGIFTPTEGGLTDNETTLGGHLSEEYEFSAPGAISKVIAVLREGDKERAVFGPIIDVCNYGEWTLIDCSAYEDRGDEVAISAEGTTSCSHDCHCGNHEKRQDETAVATTATVDDIYEMLG